MSSQFDKSGAYFAQLSEDGKLKVWNTATNTLEQEYVPDLHLTSPCTCLQFVEFWSCKSNNASPKKKKRRDSTSGSISDIALGTNSGNLIIYSISKGDVKFFVKGGINLPIGCLSPINDETFYSGAEEYIVLWNMKLGKIVNKWKSGNDKISALLALPLEGRLLTASKSIKLWDIDNKALLKTFKGHSSEVHLLHCFPCSESSESTYVISGSKSDRLLNCWNINENTKDKNAVVSLLMEDSIMNLSSNVLPDGSVKLAACVASGVAHIFHLVLNGRSSKPMKPKSTIQVVSDTGQKKDTITSIPIVSCFFRSEDSLMITHGNSILLKFEDIELINQKLICLVRNPQIIQIDETKKSKIINPVIGNDIHYVTPFNNVDTAKRKAEGKLEVPMEKRLENLTINKLEDGQVPKAGNMAQLLLQGLRSKDQTIIKTVLSRRDEQVIKSTLKRLPMKVISQLVKELTNLIQGKTISSQTGALWLKHLMQIHAALLISNPNLPDLFAPMMNSIEHRLTLLAPLNRLKGRLNLLVSQVSVSSEEFRENEEAMLIFNDKDSSDSDQEDVAMAELLNSASENEWSEEQSSDEEMVENNKSIDSDDDDDDDEMS
ncbi:hypothetical protein WA026_023765 [Henosepilachna vigintioctopunctata]|uniref:Small-subunit processome Utp12 domain-containing protein n=1 Tax=Henosepilachna vigintioctopunctata TaxID=420089 RepID=A0AAW1USH3_9CUCU